MALLQTQDFEGQTSGTTITVGNSGTAPSTAYTAVNTTSVTVQYDSTHPMHGTNGLKVATAGTGNPANGLQTFTGVPTVYGRFYFWATDFTSTQQMGARLRASATQAIRICFDSTGHITFHDTGNSTSGMPVGSVALSTGTYYRVEFTCTPGTSTTGAATANVYLGDSLTLLDTITTSSGNFGTANITEYGIGLFTGTASVNPWWFDDTNINDSALPGPSGAVSVSSSDTGTGTDGGESLAVSVSDSDTATGVDGGESIGVASADTGAGVDAGEALSAAVSSTETGSGADAGESLAVAVSSADTGSGVDAGSVATSIGVPWLDQYVAGYSFAVLLGFGVDTTTSVSGWSLTDVTADVLQGDGSQGVTIVRGRLDEFSQTSPASCVFTLKNGADGGNGRYTPRRPQSDLWPYVREGVPCQVLIIHSTTEYEQFAGFVDEFAPEFDETGNLSLMHVTAHGSLQPLQNSQKPLRSPLLRTISTVPVAPYAYWPMEDGSTATNFASAIAGVAALAVIGSVSIGSTGGPGTAASGDFAGGGSALASMRVPSGTPVWRVAFAFSPTSATQSFVPIHINTNTGTVWELEFDTTSTNVTLGVGSQPAGAVSSTWSTFTGVPWAVDSWHEIVLDALNTGSDMGYVLTVDGVAQSNHHAFLSQQLGAITSIVLSPQPPTFSTSTSDSFRIAHLAVWSSNPSDDLSSPCAGWTGENAIARMTRLCSENSIIFAADGTSNKAMGPQGVATLASLLRDAEAVDGGVLEDGVGFGCFMHTAGARSNQAATMALALTDLVPVFQPIENNSKVVNDAVVSMPDGSTAEYIQAAGRPYAPTGVGGVGYLERPFSLNLDDANQLSNRASWYVHQGTIDEDRYQTLTLNLARSPGEILSWLACLLGSRVTVTGNYSTGGVNGADLLLEGWTFALSRLLGTIAANLSPAVAWRIAVVDNPLLGRVSGAGSTLHADINAVVTTLVMDTITPWTTTALNPGAFPSDYDLDGEQITVGACAGSAGSYTFTSVTRSVNGVVKSHSAGAPIKVWRPGVVSL